MNSKKIIAGILSIAVVFAAAGIYWYKAKISADTAETLTGTRLQMVDTAGEKVKQNIPLELSFKATVRVCKVVRLVFTKYSRCHWEDRNFKRVALTSNEGTYSVGTESYRPLTEKEAKIVVQNLAAEKANRELNADEKARLDRVTQQAMGIKSPTNAQVEGMVQEAFKDYIPPATDEVRTTSVNRPVASLIGTAATTGAAVAAGSAVTLAGGALVGGAGLSATGALVGGVTTGVGSAAAVSAASAAVSTLGSTAASGAANALNTIAGGAKWLFTTPTGWAVLAGAILLSTFSTKTTEKWFTLLSVDVKTAGDFYKGGPLTLYYQKDKDTTSEKYAKDAKFAVDLNDFDSTFYGQAADQLYNKFISSNTSISSAGKENFKTLLAANVAYLGYARLHGYGEANTNKNIADLIKKIVDGQVAKDTSIPDANLLKNGGFEEADAFKVWEKANLKGGEETIITSSDSFKCLSGNKCLKTNSNGSGFEAVIQKMGKLSKGKYRLYASYRGEAGTRGEINIMDRTHDIQHDLFGSTEADHWKTIMVDIEVPNDDTSFDVVIYGNFGGVDKGVVYYDDIVFYKVS